MTANLVLVNARIYTLDEKQPFYTAVAIDRDRILAVGSDNDMANLLEKNGQIIDLGGSCVIPGLVDAHVHFQGYALNLQRIDLSNVRSLTKVLERVGEEQHRFNANEWILGRGWNQEDWQNKNFPNADDLDHVVSEKPALLLHRSGHAAWVNSRALQEARVNSDTPDPPGGKIQRDDAGQPTGILFEKAINIIDRHRPRANQQQIISAMRTAQEKCLKLGLTGIHDYDGRTCFGALQILHLSDSLKLRVVKNIPVRYLDYAIGLGLRTGFGDLRLRIGGIKMFADGALGPKTAAMIAPYEDDPNNWGLQVTDKEEMLGKATLAVENGLSLTIHAIGDRANHDVLDVYEAISRFPGNKEGILRHRIEHAQVLHPDDFNRFFMYGTIASMQPIHATSDMEMATRHWGERAAYSYAWRSLIDSGATLAFGSDAPVEPIDPLLGIHAAVTRRRQDGTPGKDGWHPEQRIMRKEAIKGYTLGPAIAAGNERLLGTITPGKLADFTIMDQDLFEIPADDLLDVQVLGTIIGGQLLHFRL